MKKETVKKYFEQVLKGGLIGLGLTLGITFGVLSIYAFNWAGVSTATTSTNLTANMWNTTMSTITGAVQTLENSMVALTGDQTIVGTKTFSSPIVGQTPTVNNHLATKGYVDGVTSSIPTGAIMSFYLASCPTGWILANGASGTPDLRGAFVRGMGGDANGRDVARALGDYQADTFASHLHSIDPPSTTTNTNGNHRHVLDSATVGISPTNYPPARNSDWGSNGTTLAYTDYDGNHTHTLDIGAFNSASAGGTETRPKNIALIYCMKQ